MTFYHSRPGATAKILCQFDSYTQPNGNTFVNSSPYYIDDDPYDLECWDDATTEQRTAIMDFLAAWFDVLDVDVTDEGSPDNANTWTVAFCLDTSFSAGSGGSTRGAPLLNRSNAYWDTDHWIGAACTCYVFIPNLASGLLVYAHAACHEMGHNIAHAEHASDWTGHLISDTLVREYGYGESPDTSPIMGSSNAPKPYRAWRKGQYGVPLTPSDATQEQDVVALLAAQLEETSGVPSQLSSDPLTRTPTYDAYDMLEPADAPTPPVTSIACDPSIIPPNHSQYITIVVTGTDTEFDGTTVFESDIAEVEIVDYTVLGAESAEIRLFTGNYVGPVTISETETGDASTVITVAGVKPNPMFPTSSIWNQDISAAPLHELNDLWIDIINGHAGHEVHENFGSAEYAGNLVGIPVNYIYGSTITPAAIEITSYASQSDAIPGDVLPIPAWAVFENDNNTGPNPEDGGADQHCLLYDLETDKLHELYHVTRNLDEFDEPDGTYTARQYSTWDATSNTLRTNGWTSTDAAGLPIIPLLVDYDEVAAAVISGGTVGHAFRFTLDLSSASFLWPARHYAGSGGPLNPPMGMRVRLKASYDETWMAPMTQAICRTLKKEGMFLADNGGDWFIQGKPDLRWNDTHCQQLRDILPLTDIEVVDTSNWQVSANSAEANPANPVRDIRIKDEVDYGVTLAGNFASRLGGGMAGAHNSLAYYAYADGSGDTFVKYNVTGLISGKRYKVAYMWPQNPFGTFATNAPWTIYDSDGTTVLASGTLDFTQAPGDFTDAQTGFTGNWLDQDIRLTGTEMTIEVNGNANSFVLADAVWVEGVAEAIVLTCSLPA